MPTTRQLNHPSSTKNVQALLAAARQRLQQNQLLEAAQCFFEVTRLDPHCFDAFCQLGALLNQLNKLEEACVCLQMAVRLKPNFPKLNLLLGGVLKKLGRFEESAACCRREIQIEPGNPDAHYNLGLVLQNLGRLDEAIIAYQNAIGLRPEYADALINLGCVRRQRLEAEAALLCFEEALRREPQNPEVHWELCTTLLALGDFERGWKEYEWRWKQKGFATPPARFEQPRWDGSDLNGRRIFLHTEQGYGDVIQFARYATLVAGRGGEVIVGCPQPLHLLIQTIPGVREVVTGRLALPSFDVHAPLMSLPAIFGTTLPTVPSEIPYLTPPRNDFKLENTDERQCKVGIVWAGDPSHKNDRNRSLPLNCFSPLMELPGIRWYSLQVGNRVRDLSQLQLEGRITDLGSRFRDFGDTAQAIAQLDLVISVDTSVVHLAGALGKSVWTLLPFEAEWRWMLGREDSPWYSTMRLFRQSSPGNWKSLLDHVVCELTKFTSRRTAIAASGLFLSTL